MNRRTSYQIIAPNPDKRCKDLFIAHCISAADVQEKIVEADLDVERTIVVAGERVQLRKQVLILVGEPAKRRGRPPGSKNKSKRVNKNLRKVKAAARSAASKTKGKVKSKRDLTMADVITRKPAKRSKLTAKAIVAAAKETQTERNARIEIAT